MLIHNEDCLVAGRAASIRKDTYCHQKLRDNFVSYTQLLINVSICQSVLTLLCRGPPTKEKPAKAKFSYL